MAPNPTTPITTDNKAFSLSHRKNIRDNEKFKAEHLAKIATVTGVPDWDFEFQGDAAKFNEEICGDYKDRFGEILFGQNSYLSNVADLLERCMKDDMTKEAFVDAVKAKKVAFRPDQGAEGYFRLSIEDGIFVVTVPPSNFWTNISDISYYRDLDKML
eukprot:TRINITY_DN1717_c0_g3_i2.p1 TRINITY_DN1717_c0_g3~~TRINITY_DN1717_c0_g3_i2.p1  ORF type:complete len:158 (+),score=48.03 TRINITY_DN1717_c0_g3_i2:92-565(+)